MLKKIMVILLVQVLVLNLTGCLKKGTQVNKLNEDIEFKQEQISEYNQEIQRLREELDKYRQALTINYFEYEEKKRFVEKELLITAIPREGILPLNMVHPNTVVEVEDAAEVDDQGVWLYVVVPVYDSPANFKGWIRELDTVPYTKEKQKLVQSEIYLNKGTPYIGIGVHTDNAIEENSVNDLPEDSIQKLPYNQRGRIENKINGYVRVIVPGGESLWIKEEYIIFPSVN
ncbi:hypothetical protein SAMN05660297_02401 [Natronincola peptidivorans]|uniref:SH3 domain-containing protein n=1 Tax=Natronincola peptidivorans TaxID=426128 RepID=A0A1I0EDM6_9FIRM|nr:hypothetical protein [Natronincola peptidivorans]SET43150.1 hypothetical protein SAMN05660297_02401 [Natronincola peptidivorans]